MDCCSWAFPSILAKDAIGFNVSLNPRVLKRFHMYIQNQSGLTEPADFGGATWGDVKPLTNLSAIELGTDLKLVAAQRVLFYWTIRYTAWDTESYYAKVVAAVTKANNDVPVEAFLNCNNFHGRLFEPLGSKVTMRGEKQPVSATATGRGGAKVRGSVVGESAKGGVDWFEAGRLHTGDIMWTEDW